MHSRAFGDSNLTRGKKKRQKKKYCKNGQECKRNGGQTGMRRREEDWQGAKQTKQGKNEKMRQEKRYGTAQYSQGGRMNVRD